MAQVDGAGTRVEPASLVSGLASFIRLLPGKPELFEGRDQDEYGKPEPIAASSSVNWAAPATMPAQAASQTLATVVRFLTLPLGSPLRRR